MKGLLFAKELQAVEGDRVTVVTGFPNYPAGKIYDGYRIRPITREVRDGVEIVRLPLVPGHGRNPLWRIANYLSFFASLLVWGLFAARKYDLVYVYHPPMTVGFAAALFSAVHRKPFILEVQDLWPESVVASGISGAGALERGLAAMCRFVYRRAAHIVAQSHGMADRLIERGANASAMSVIYNWSNSEPAPLPPRSAPGGAYEFLYTGNLGIYQDLGTAIAATRIAHAADPRVRLTMIGNGAEKARLAASLTDADRAFIRFRDSVPQEDLLEIVANADCLLLHLRDMPFFEFTIPSKIPFYLAMARPVLAGIRGEAAGILRDSGAAEVVAPESPDAMARAMVTLAGETPARREARGRQGAAYYHEHLARNQAIRRTRALFVFPDGGKSR